MEQNRNYRMDAGRLRAFCGEAFLRTGVPEADAGIIADQLVQAQMRGVKSHGVSKMLQYTDYLIRGVFQKETVMTYLSGAPGMAALDAGGGMGAVAGVHAMALCIKKARQTGVACVTVRNANHFGMAAYYAMKAPEADMIGVALCNSGKCMTIYGGNEPMLGTNPICVAVPAGKYDPIVYDGATSVVAYNKIRLARTENTPLGEGWALDKDGNPTADPEKALAGALNPFGSYKGSGLAVIVQILSGVLSGHMLCPSLVTAQHDGLHTSVGFCFAAVDIGKFQEVGQFKRSMDEMIGAFKRSRRAGGCDEILMPGERESRAWRDSRENGAEVGAGVFLDLRGMQQTLGMRSKIEDCIVRASEEAE